MKLLYSIIHVDQCRHIGSKNIVITFTQLIYPSYRESRPDLGLGNSLVTLGLHQTCSCQFLSVCLDF